jgi:hypothetical protein
MKLKKKKKKPTNDCITIQTYLLASERKQAHDNTSVVAIKFFFAVTYFLVRRDKHQCLFSASEMHFQRYQTK